MRAPTPVSRAGRLAVGLARHRLLFPALYLRPKTQRSPAEALEALGFDGARVAELETEYDRAAAELFPVLERRAREAGADDMAARLADPELPTHANKRLVYVAVRLVRPRAVFETGTFSGGFSTFVLRARADNGAGVLWSFDVPAYRPIRHAIDIPLPPGHEPGWIVPDELRERMRLVLGDARDTLPPALAEAGSIGVFVHDSLHTTRHMLFEYGAAWQHLVPGGLLISDDVFRTPAYWWFTTTRRVPFVHVGNMAVTRKPGGGLA